MIKFCAVRGRTRQIGSFGANGRVAIGIIIVTPFDARDEPRPQRLAIDEISFKIGFDRFIQL
jgi:hypothetical protein